MFDLTVIIVSWNVRELLRGCLDSLRADLQGAGLAAEVWVVDSASADGSAAMVAREFPSVRLAACTENVGFVRGNNLALRQAAPARYAWLLNPDTQVRPGAVESLLGFLDAAPQAGMAGAQLRNADGSLQHGAFRFPGLLQAAFDLFGVPPRLYETPLNGRYPPARYAAGLPFAVDFVLGASMMVRRAAVEQVGLLDEGFWMYCEEIDWAWRMQRAGWQVCCVPQAEVVHYAGRSSDQVPLASFERLWTSRARLYAKHHRPPVRWLAARMVDLACARKARGATPELAAACRRVRAAWKEVSI